MEGKRATGKRWTKREQEKDDGRTSVMAIDSKKLCIGSRESAEVGEVRREEKL